MTGPDLSLRRVFGALRRADERTAPLFRDMMARAREGRPGRARSLPVRVGAVAVAVAATVLLVLRLAPPGDDLPAAALHAATWRAPTDFLLDTPGADLLRSVPELGDLPDVRPKGLD